MVSAYGNYKTWSGQCIAYFTDFFVTIGILTFSKGIYMGLFGDKTAMIASENALSGREQRVSISGTHTVLNSSMLAPFPEGSESFLLGFGCFWGAERLLWQQAGVITTAVGYAAGYTPNPSYEEVCTGKTGHNEVVLVVFDPQKTSFLKLLKVFWEAHDPTQGMRQGNDTGTQYRSGIYCSTEDQLKQAEGSMQAYQSALKAKDYSAVTTELIMAPELYYAEEYHQQYLDKNPDGYCGLAGTGVSCAI